MNDISKVNIVDRLLEWATDVESPADLARYNGKVTDLFDEILQANNDNESEKITLQVDAMLYCCKASFFEQIAKSLMTNKPPFLCATRGANAVKTTMDYFESLAFHE